MKVSNGHFPHPVTGEIIRPGEMYMEFDENALLYDGGLGGKEDRAGSRAEGATNVTDGGGEEVKGGKSGNLIKPLREYTVSVLKQIAEEKGIEGCAGMKKADLIAALESMKADADSVSGGE